MNAYFFNSSYSLHKHRKSQTVTSIQSVILYSVNVGSSNPYIGHATQYKLYHCVIIKVYSTNGPVDVVCGGVADINDA